MQLMPKELQISPKALMVGSDNRDCGKPEEQELRSVEQPNRYNFWQKLEKIVPRHGERGGVRLG